MDASLAVFVFLVVPGTVLLLGGLGVWLQARANRAVQVHVKRLDELNASRPQPTSE